MSTVRCLPPRRPGSRPHGVDAVAGGSGYAVRPMSPAACLILVLATAQTLVVRPPPPDGAVAAAVTAALRGLPGPAGQAVRLVAPGDADPARVAAEEDAEAVLWAEVTPAGVQLALYRSASGRVVRADLALPPGASPAAVREAVALRAEYLLETPAGAGEPHAGAAPPPTLPTPPPAPSPALLAELRLPPHPDPPRRASPIIPPVPMASGGAGGTEVTLEVRRTEDAAEPDHSHPDTVSAALDGAPGEPPSPSPGPALRGWFGGGALADLDHLEGGFDVGLRARLTGPWWLRAEGAVFPFRDLGDAHVTFIHASLAAERALADAPLRLAAHAGLAYDGLRVAGPGAGSADHRAAAVLGAGLQLPLGGPLAVGALAEGLLSPWALAVSADGRTARAAAVQLRLGLHLAWALDAPPSKR